MILNEAYYKYSTYFDPENNAISFAVSHGTPNVERLGCNILYYPHRVEIVRDKLSEETNAFIMAANQRLGLGDIGSVYRKATKMKPEEAALFLYGDDEEARDLFDYEELREELLNLVSRFGYKAPLEEVVRNA